MGISIYPHGSGKIRVQVKQSGIKKTKVFRENEKRKARAWGSKTLTDIYNHTVAPYTDRMTLSDVLDLYLEEAAIKLKGAGQANKKSIVARIKKEDFAKRRIDKIHKGEMKVFKTKLISKEGKAQSTARHYLTTISCAFDHYIDVKESGITNPVKKIQLPKAYANKRDFVISKSEMKWIEYSDANRPVIPTQTGHPFRLNPATHSGANRPPCKQVKM